MVFIMYNSHTLQVYHLIKKLVRSIEIYNVATVQTCIKSEAAFQNEEDRKVFYKSYDKYDETQKIAHN